MSAGWTPAPSLYSLPSIRLAKRASVWPTTALTTTPTSSKTILALPRSGSSLYSHKMPMHPSRPIRRSGWEISVRQPKKKPRT